MKIKLMNFVMLGLAAIFLFACQSKNQTETPANANPDMHTVSVVEVMHTMNYTYLNVLENSSNYWIAIRKRETKEGEVLYFTGGMEMKNFESKELGRVFPVIYFVDNISDQPIPAGTQGQEQADHPGDQAVQGQQQPAMPAGKKAPVREEGVKVAPPLGGISLEKLFGDKSSFEGKTITVAGKVVRYNAGIMNKNWVHIQDGTRAGDEFDLTVTTLETVKLGDVVAFKGRISLNKDFGAGYTYDIIMEDAVVVKK